MVVYSCLKQKKFTKQRALKINCFYCKYFATVPLCKTKIERDSVTFITTSGLL